MTAEKTAVNPATTLTMDQPVEAGIRPARKRPETFELMSDKGARSWMANATAWTGFRAALIALCLSLPTGATAASLSLGDAALEVGSVADLAISVDDASGIEGASMRVTYDPAVVRMASEVHVTSMTSGCMLVSNTRQPGLVQIGLACVQPLSGSGPLLTIKVLGHGVGSSGLTISGCNINEGAMTCTQNPGVASVQAASDPVSNPAAAPSEDLARTGEIVP